MDCYQMSFSLVEYIRNRYCLLFNHQISDKGGGFLNLFFVLLLHLVLIVSVHFSRSVVSNSLQPHGLQHTRPPCPSPTPGVYPNSFPLSRWCHPTTSSSVILFSSRLQSFPAPGSFPVSQFFASGGQSIGVSASALVLISFRTDWLDLLAVQRILKSLLQHQSPKASILWCFLYSPTLTSIHDYRKNHSFD